jgi:AraC-like DNA-binding protein
MFQTVLGSASELLSFDGPIFSVVVNAVSFLGKHIELTLSKSILAAIPDIEMFGGAIRDLETNIGALPYEIAAMESRLGTSTKAAVEAIGEEFASLPERFSENYDKNIKDPLFQMEERMAETAEHAAKIEESLENAFKTGDHSPIPQWLSDSINAPAPVTEQPPVEQVPDTGKSLGVSASGSGPAERQMSAREKSMIESRMRRADEYERKGFFSSAERERQAAESTIARSRQREALRAVQKDRNLQGGSTMTPEEIARRSGFSDLNKEKFDAEVEKIKGQIAARAGQGDGTEAGPAGRSKSEPTQSPLEKLVSEIKTLVAKIEPKLPVSALTA